MKEVQRHEKIHCKTPDTIALLSLTCPGRGLRPLSLPFRVMDWLDPTQMKLVFAAEFVLYITVLGLVTPAGKRNWLPKSRLCPQTAPPRRLARQGAHRRRLVSTTTADAGHIAA